MRSRVAAGLGLLLCLTPVAAAARSPITVAADERIGGFRVKADGSLRGAVAAFGAPTTLKRTSDSSCTATWRAISLTIFVYNLGGEDACTPRGGRFNRATMRGPVWRTTKGLRVGDPVGRLRRLYPAARLHRGLRYYWPAGYWLVPRPERFGNGGTYPGLLAETRGGRVTGLHVRYQAGGD